MHFDANQTPLLPTLYYNSADYAAAKHPIMFLCKKK